MACAPDVDIKIPVGDLTPALRGTLKDGTLPQNLTAVTEVIAYFQKWRSPSTAVMAYACQIVPPEDEGVVDIVWDVTEEFTPPPAGLYRLWYKVTFNTGLPQTFPQDRDLLVLFWTHGQD